jgi:hypothetical protein
MIASAVAFTYVSGAIPASAQITEDGELTAAIAEQCNYNPYCIAVEWAAVEAQRCANGIGVPGGCIGPGGEGAKLVCNIFGICWGDD